MPSLLRPDDLKQMYSNAEKARMDEARLYDKHKQEQDLKLREEFMSREIHQEAIDRINSAIIRAANKSPAPCRDCYVPMQLLQRSRQNN